MHHDVNISRIDFERIEEGSKTFLVQASFMELQKGDTFKLQEYRGELWPNAYTGNHITCTVGYVLPIDDKRVVISLLDVKAHNEKR